jgi:hypothetical protein
VHTSEPQSAFEPHTLLCRQSGAHAGEPQRSFLHTPDEQSPVPAQSAPSEHAGVQAAHVVPLQSSVMQLVPAVHATPTAQLGEQVAHLPPEHVPPPAHGVAPAQQA